MKIYIPMRKDSAVYWANVMTQNCVPIEGENALWVKDMTAFFRKKDAQKWIDDFNTGMKYPIEMKIVAFESK
jgi:hypothetical protein